MPGRTTFHNTVISALPSDLDPSSLISLLHNHSYIIHTQPLVTRFEADNSQQNGSNSNIASNPSQNQDKAVMNPKITYNVWEEIPMLPFHLYNKEIHFTASFQDTPTGVQTRVDAPMGFVSEAVYTVRRREVGDEEALGAAGNTKEGRAAGGHSRQGSRYGITTTANKTADSGAGAGMTALPTPAASLWVLEERIRSECNFLFKPFVQSTMVPVRRKMHEGMMERAKEEQAKGPPAVVDDDKARGNWI